MSIQISLSKKVQSMHSDQLQIHIELTNLCLSAENSGTQKEFMPVKRLRLTHLRQEVRLGNQCSVIQAPAEN